MTKYKLTVVGPNLPTYKLVGTDMNESGQVVGRHYAWISDYDHIPLLPGFLFDSGDGRRTEPSAMDR
jgi:hypothetical protein